MRFGGGYNPASYIAGVDGARQDPVMETRCDACGQRGTGMDLRWLDGIAVSLCTDVTDCSARYRGGVSAETYAAGLRGELLAVAP